MGSINEGASLAATGAGSGVVTGAGGAIGLDRRGFGFGFAALAAGCGGGGSSVIVATSGGTSGTGVKSTGHSESAKCSAIEAANAITKIGRAVGEVVFT
ncbi:MAG: hypothetical protein ABI569_17105 [Casimicrobiaceae bacterium]